MVGVCLPQVGAQFCIFEAKDDTLMEFTDQGSLYTTNVTYGNVDGNIVWQPQNVSANMMGRSPELAPSTPFALAHLNYTKPASSDDLHYGHNVFRYGPCGMLTIFFTSNPLNNPRVP